MPFKHFNALKNRQKENMFKLPVKKCKGSNYFVLQPGGVGHPKTLSDFVVSSKIPGS